jgi:hypothetical protein
MPNDSAQFSPCSLLAQLPSLCVHERVLNTLRDSPSDSGCLCFRFSVIRVCDEAGNVIETQEHAGDFKEWSTKSRHAVKRDG